MPEISFIRDAPKVYVAGVSTPDFAEISRYLEDIGANWKHVGAEKPDDPEALVEVAGRLCYESWNNPAGKTRQQYICSSILEHAHGSVLEHVWINLIIRDLPRSSQLELVRHGEGTAFSFESTRFTDKRLRFVIPPRMRGDLPLEEAFMDQCCSAVRAYETLRDLPALPHEEGTLKRKRAKEMARSLLPNALASDGMVSINLRAVRWILQARSDLHADLSLREMAFAVYTAIYHTVPKVLVDASVSPTDESIPVIRFANPKV